MDTMYPLHHFIFLKPIFMSNENQRPTEGQEQQPQQEQQREQAFTPSPGTLKVSEERKEAEKREESLTPEKATPSEAKPETDEVN
jgi:hypothetical protein